MADRTDERTVDSESDVDLDGFADDGGAASASASGGGDDGGAGDSVGFDDDELGVDVDALTGDPGEDTASGTSIDAASAGSGGRTDAGGPGLLSRLRPSLGVPSPPSVVPSPRSVGLSLGTVVVSMLAFGALLPLGDVGSIVGIFVGAFLLGILSGQQRYLELVTSGAVAAAISVVLGRLLLSAIAGLAVPLAAVGAAGGAAAALLGHYFGRDLRDGLTRDV